MGRPSLSLFYILSLISRPQSGVFNHNMRDIKLTPIICGNKMPTRWDKWYLLQILLHAQHVSGTIMPILRSSRVLYRWSLPVVFGALVFRLSVWCGAEGYVLCDDARSKSLQMKKCYLSCCCFDFRIQLHSFLTSNAHLLLKLFSSTIKFFCTL